MCVCVCEGVCGVHIVCGCTIKYRHVQYQEVITCSVHVFL